MFSFMKNKKAKGKDDDMEMSDANTKASEVNKAEEKEEVDHGMECAKLRFMLKCGIDIVPNRSDVVSAFMSKVRAKNMVGYYLSACDMGLVDKDTELVATMVTVNKEEAMRLEEKEKDAAENHGDIEVMEARLTFAKFKGLTGTKEEALEAYDKVASVKALSTGQMIDIKLKKIILGFVWMDTHLVKDNIEEANVLMELGGDWDRRNRLKVYNGLFSVVSRNFMKASEDLLSGVATFTASELCTYETFIFYTVITSIIALGRVDFKKKVIDSPEVLAVVREVPSLHEFCITLHDCDYKGFFQSLISLNAKICTDRYLAVHKDWFFREVRVLAYVQFLESYKSVTIASMAKSFGVTAVFVDKELAHFISSGRINAKIDKVAGVIETCRPNETNGKYQSVIKQGDLLLNRVQILSRAINV